MSEEGWSAVDIPPDDDVAGALRALESGPVRARCGSDVIVATLAEPVALGHKFALRAIAAGQAVRKYGEPTGVAMCNIALGAHVHVLTLRSNRARKSG